MNLFLLAAAGLAIMICLIHLVIGGREIARRHLDNQTLHRDVKFTMYYCWHLVTITLAGMAFAFLLAAMPEGSRALGLFATIGAGLFALLCIGINAAAKLRTRHHPQWVLFLPVAALGAIGLWL